MKMIFNPTEVGWRLGRAHAVVEVETDGLEDQDRRNGEEED